MLGGKFADNAGQIAASWPTPRRLTIVDNTYHIRNQSQRNKAWGYLKGFCTLPTRSGQTADVWLLSNTFAQIQSTQRSASSGAAGEVTPARRLETSDLESAHAELFEYAWRRLG